jgi:vancomycin resistance protein YoaR
MESKNNKFKRLANKRVPAAIEKLELVKNLSNTNNYEYSKEEVDKIMKALTSSLNEVKKSFDEKNTPKFEI